MPHFAPISPSGLVTLVTDRVLERNGPVLIAIDGADAARPTELADRIAAALRATGRAADVVALRDYVRPAALRMEFGRADEMSYRTLWFDYDAIRREVIDAVRDSGRWLPALWDAQRDRSARAALRTAAPDAVLLVAGPMLLGRGLNFDLTVRLDMSAAALRRTTPAADQWTINALLRHSDEHPEVPTLFLRWDHPDRAALALD